VAVAESKTQEERLAPPILMRDYLPRFRKQAVTLIVLSETALTLLIAFILTASGALSISSLWFWVAIVAVGLLLIITHVALFWLLASPFRDLVRAVLLVSGEPTVLTPPNPNTHKYSQDGFKQILQTIYELAAKEDEPVKKPLTVDQTLELGLSNTTNGLIILDPERKIVYNNSKSPVHINTTGDRILDLIFPDGDTLNAWLDKCEKKSVRAEQQWFRVADKLPGEKGRRMYDVSASYQKNSPAETVLVLFDRTGTYAPEEDDLDFISFAAHELRGPITVIRGYLDVLEDELQPVLRNDQAELLQRLIVSANRLSSYVNNILNASRYDRRHFKIHLSEETVVDIYDTIRDDMELRASSQNRLLAVDIPTSLPTVAADSNSIGEVLSNLVDNAIKYSNEGGLIQIIARPISGYVEIAIVDRGIGMPGSVIPNLFHKFYRSHRSRETVAGTGIGLYISKAIVESHGGIITARSTEREGSTFTFTLPIYETVADKIKAGDNSNTGLIEHGSGWIRNHSMYRG
jgi:signal transduction histidine kinase